MNMERLTSEREAEWKRTLSKSRFCMGLANLFFSGEESSLAGMKVMIIRFLGGNDIHLAMISGFGVVVAFIQGLSVPLLNFLRSNRKAMAFALSLGALSGVLLMLATLGGVLEEYRTFFLYLFLFSTLLMTAATGIQLSVETNWIGDLVSLQLRGWFTGAKSAISLVGIMVLGLIFGFIVDNSRSLLHTAALLYFVVTLSHIWAICLILKVPDREPKPAALFAHKNHSGVRMNFKSRAFWCYVGFCMLWGGGRSLMFTFTAVFLIEFFGLGLVELSGLSILSSILSIGMLLLLGRLSDKRGNRKLLMLISAVCGATGFLWLTTPWFGIAAVLTFNVVNSLAGATHSMLINNYGLEIFSEQGRAAYYALARMLNGATSLIIINLGGVVCHFLERHSIQLTIGSCVLTRYHIMFAIGATLATASFSMFYFAGNRKIEPLYDNAANENTQK